MQSKVGHCGDGWSSGQKIIGAYHGENPRKTWCAPISKEDMKLKKEDYLSWLAQGTPESAE